MIRLTPELWTHSTFLLEAAGVESRQLDYNLARRSAVIVNQVIGKLFIGPDTTTGFEIGTYCVQELDTDPDNVEIEFPAAPGDNVSLDSSRPFLQTTRLVWDTAAGPTNAPNTIQVKDWTNLPMEQRPISITAMRHHVRMLETISCTLYAELDIYYFIVELSLLEIGIINASRR